MQSQSLPNGTALGEYTLIRLIGRGGMGEVYEAYESKLHRRVALKIIAPLQPDEHDYEDLFRRFLQEARTLAQVNHPNIVTIYDIDRAGGAQFIAMEFVNGLSLKQMLKEITLSLEEAVPIFAQILEGLNCLHENHIIHRDLKPHNILLRTDGQVKILDFGIAKQTLPGQGEGTQLGVIAGTLPYMAPEVKVGESASTASDIYSLGAIFYELLIGRALARVMLDHPNSSDVPWSREDIARIPQGMRDIINKMCSHFVKNRYQKTSEVMEDLKKFRQVRPPVPPEIYDSMVKKVAAIADLKRKEVTSDFSFTSLKNNSPMATELRPLNPERRRSKRKAKRRKELLQYAMIAATGVVAAGVWFAIKNFTASTAPLPMPQPVIPVSPMSAPTAKGDGSPQPVALTEPKDQDTLWLEPARIPTLSWSRPLNAREYQIQIATDARFKKVIVEEPVSGTSFRPATVLPEGKYFWRLEPKTSQGHLAGPMSFVIAHLTPVELLSPIPQAALEAKGETVDVDFQWKCKPGAKLYRVQVSTNPDFSNMAREQVLPSCLYKLPRLAIGGYFWRVRMEETGPTQAPWSESRSLIIRPYPIPNQSPIAYTPPLKPVRTSTPAELSEPRLKKPLTSVVLQFRGQPRDLASLHKSLTESPRLEWQPVKGARSYQVQFSSSKDFTHILDDEKTASPRLDWKNAIPGRVFWRVRALDSAGNASEYSSRGMIIANIPAPKIKDSYKISLNGEVDWEPVPLAEKYLVQIDTTRTLANADELVVDGAKVPAEPKPSKYFVRVAAADGNGEPISAFSTTSTVIVEGASIDKPKNITPGTGARAPSSGGRLSVKFTWTPVPGAEMYAVELAADPEFNQVIQKLRTPQAVFLLKQAPLTGRVYWRVRAESAKGNSEWSAPSFFDVR